MADDKATAVPKAEVFAFFTTGDTRPSRGVPPNAPRAAKLTSSERYRKRAESLATVGRVMGVDSIQEATAALRALPPDVKLVKVFFVGHGFNDGFFFHGRPDPDDAEDFIADNGDTETLRDPSKTLVPTNKSVHEDLIQELTKHLHKTAEVEIGFLSCFTGTGSTVSAVGRALDRAGFQNYVVGGYKNNYQTLYDFDATTGAITQWRDAIFDRRPPKKELVRVKKNEIPPFETECGKSNDPLSTRLPC